MLESWGNLKESPGKEFEVVSPCDPKKVTLCGNEGDGDRSTREKEERKA